MYLNSVNIKQSIRNPVSLLEVNVIDRLQISQTLRDWITVHANWPFHELVYLENFAVIAMARLAMQHIFVMQNQKILAYFPIERIPYPNRIAIFLGLKPIYEKQQISGFGEAIYAPGVAKDSELVSRIILALLDHFRNNRTFGLVFDNLRSDSPIYAAISELTNNFTVNRLELADFPVMHILSTKQKSPKPKDSNLTREEYLERRARLAKVRHTFETNLAPTGELINEFFRLHKLADTSKPKFMSARMEKLIRYLINLPFTNWKLRLARLQIFGETAALLLYYVSKDCILGYQAGSDANFSYYSPQLLSAALLMEQAQQSGKKKSDLICGLESYKAAITEVPGKLYRIEIKMEHKKLFWKV